VALNDATLNELREQTKWLRLLGLSSLHPLITSALKTDRDRLVYELSDGMRSTRDLAKLTGLSPMTVSRLWRDWLAMGICEESQSKPGRAQHLVSLSKLGIAVPKMGQATGASADIAAAKESET
jgi:hypothetical protein